MPAVALAKEKVEGIVSNIVGFLRQAVASIHGSIRTLGSDASLRLDGRTPRAGPFVARCSEARRDPNGQHT